MPVESRGSQALASQPQGLLSLSLIRSFNMSDTLIAGYDFQKALSYYRPFVFFTINLLFLCYSKYIVLFMALHTVCWIKYSSYFKAHGIEPHQ